MLSPSRISHIFPVPCSMFTVHRSLLALGPVLLFAVTLSFAAEPAPDVKPAEQNSKTTAPAEPKVPEKIRTLMQDRDYAGAVTALDEAIKALKETDKGGDYLTYLKGRALHLQNKYDEAATAYDVVEKNFPKSTWARRARFGKAVSLMRKGDFKAAELIYRAEVEYLLSQDRKQEIADVYLEFAETFFKPTELTVQPNYQKALEFYNQALAVGPKADRRAEIELQVARCQQLLNKHAEAAQLFQKFIKDHADHKLLIEARFRLGEVQLAMGQPVEARRTWQDLLAAHVDSKSERIAEATYNLSLTYGLPTPNSTEDLTLGVAALENFLKKFPDHKLASAAHLRIAQSYLHRGRFDDGVKSLKKFLAEAKYADREEVPDARQLLGTAFQAQKKFPEALAAWQEYLTKNPAHRAWSDVQRQIVNTEYLIGADKREAKQYDAARKVWTDFVQKYPLDGRNPGILLQFGQMWALQEKWDDALTDWKRLVSTYPNTNESSQGQFLIAQTLEQKQGKLEEGLKEYKKVTWGNFAAPATQAVARLTAKSMSIATERVFRGNEVPKVKLVSRNLESVTVRVYKVNLETYFRKMHLARGVEALDIALIDPDTTIEFKVPKYAEYQQLESEIEIPIPVKKDAAAAESGVLAVTVSSKTLEATTMVIQSDLDLIVKSSRDEVFVFAENMRTGKPWPKAKLLISNGQQIFAEGETGEDGVFKQSYKELKEPNNLRVFGIANNHTASNVVDLRGIGIAQGLTERGYIFTERPAYRAGQMVHLRGIVRQVENDTYKIEKDKKFTVEVFDVRNRLVWQQEQPLSEYGSLHSNFVLPPTSPVGQYRIVLHDKENHSYQGTFTVHEYQLEPVQLTVTSDRKVFYRGEEIEGKIAVKFYYGAPLVGREVRYQLAGGRVETAKTDDKGEISFKFPTRDFRETQVLPLVVSLPERNLNMTQNFFLATQGFTFALSTVRPVYVSGETFEVSIKATDAEGKPLKQKLTLNVIEQTTVDGKVGEKEIEKHELTTDEKEGTARKTLKLEKGAHYVLRAEGIDRFENPVTGEHTVQVSDDSDRVRLRVLADKHTFKAGDTADVKLHWREEPALALVTFQGAKILDYRLMQLQKGENKLSIPMATKLAPNFELSVTVMTDARPDPKDKQKLAIRFHEATSPFTVQRDLTVKIEPKRKGNKPGEIRPGEEIELIITTTDPQGKPVMSEVSLGMIEQSLLDMFGSHVAPIQDFFRGTTRQSAMRTTSSVTFAYRPRTKSINSRLLAEAERTLLATEEAEHLRTTSDEFGIELGMQDGILFDRHNLLTTDGLASFGVGRINDPAQGGQGGNDPFGDRIVQGLMIQEESAERLLNQGVQQNDSERYFKGRLVVPLEKSMISLPLDQAAIANESALAALDANFQNNSDAFNAPQGGTESNEGRANGRNWAMQQRAGNSAGVPGNSRARLSQQQLSQNGGTVLSLSGTNTYNGGTTINAGSVMLGSNAGSLALDNNTFGNNSYNDSLANNGTLILSNGNTYTGNTVAVNPSNLHNYFNAGQRDAVVVLNNGEQVNLNFRNSLAMNDEKSVKKLSDDLNRSGALLLPTLGSQETGYWNPVVVTDKEGKASLTITVPENSTAWRFLAKGITTETLAGEATSDLKVKKDLFGELKLPTAFTDGDDAELVASVHNDLIEKGPITVVLKTTIGGKSSEEKKTLNVTKKGIEEVTFKTAIRRPEEQQSSTNPEIGASFELTVTSGNETDLVRRFVPVRPFGLPVFATAGGSASSDTTAWVEGAKDQPISAPGLQIVVGPTVERSLLDIVLEPGPWCQLESSRSASENDFAVGDLMASLALQKLLGASRDANNPQAAALDARIRASLSQLVSSQHDDGGWSWTGRGAASHRFTSARVVWALSLAKAAGYQISDEAMNKAQTYLGSQIAATAETDYETKAILLHGLATMHQGDFTLANRLYRNRTALSNGALLHLILSFVEMDRQPIAQELLTLAKDRNLDEAATRRSSALGSLPWSHSPAELRALYAYSLERVTPEAPATKEQIDWLMAHRTGHRWAPEKATGPAALAACNWFAKSRFDQDHYKLTLFVNDTQVKELDITKETGTQTIDVPAKMLKEGKQRVNFQLTGRGRFTYQCIYGGFVAADKLQSTVKEWTVTREYEPAPQELDGQEIPRGFGILQGSYSSFRNPLTQLPVGKRGQVTLDLRRNNIPANTPEDQIEYLVVTEPLPGGTTVVESSIKGGFERFDVTPGAITFYIGSRQYVETIRFDVHGYTPGVYKAGPTVMRNAYRPEQLAVSKTKTLTVLPLGGKSADEYKLSPQELYEFGKRHFAKQEYVTAGNHLSDLLAKWNVNGETYKESARMMLDIRLQTGPPSEIVRYFEIIKEKWPDLEISFEKITKVAAAYHEIGEYERSFLVFRATLESSFQRESNVAGFLDAQGEFQRSTDVMSRLLSEYPPEPYVAAATYALAQRVYAKAPSAASDLKLREKKVNRVDLVQRALAMLDNFLTAYPDDPAADQASFSVANALLELKAYKESIARCDKFAKRYPTSEFLDSYWYIIGYSHFASGEHKQALEMCQKVAEHKRLDKTSGREIESPNRWPAIYILGQVYHSLGEAAKAIVEYTKVEDRFADAKQAIEYFARKSITLPEVTTFKPSEKAEVELKFRNLPTCDVKVYRIDLMKFSLLKRNLGGITQINLSGINPLFEQSIELGDGKDYRDRTKKLELPVKEEGAYLVVARGGDLHASGLVLVSPLVVEIQEDASCGCVRTTVKDVTKDKYVNDVHVKVIGSLNQDFVSGATDLRGVFSADAIHGTSTVIAQADAGRYAFFRGTSHLGAVAVPEPAAANGAPAKQPEKPSDKRSGDNNELLEQLQRGNNDVQNRQLDYLKGIQNNKKGGVDAKSAF